MTSLKQNQHLNYDEKKMKKLMSNRESARRSRKKKQQQLDELRVQINQLKDENKVMMRKIDGVTGAFVAVNSENNVMRAQLTDLADRLRLLNNVLYVAQEVSGLVMDIPEVPDTLMEPWQLPCPVQPVTALDIDMF
ncbi:bZIP transcription factor 53 isoform X1 [Helianthus annuus]|nr:bZIP transcription factor 53 isoform X1 [Helianthus annuus]XP_022039608.1 bZIP transcription factor 53 isoform X1 [Helianthus annuus]KAJ0625356.1 putative transcription factor bZIP family [Helianthus annuus]